MVSALYNELFLAVCAIVCWTSMFCLFVIMSQMSVLQYCNNRRLMLWHGLNSVCYAPVLVSNKAETCTFVWRSGRQRGYMFTPGFLLFLELTIGCTFLRQTVVNGLKAQILRYMRLYEAVQSRREKRSWSLAFFFKADILGVIHL